MSEIDLSAGAAVSPDQMNVSLRRIASQRWFANSEIVCVLQYPSMYGLDAHKEAPHLPASGSVFLFNKKDVRGFRKDGHEWKKKKDGKNVMEHHEKLKVEHIERITCCYAHHESIEGFHRRVYWLLDAPNIVLVHYRQQHTQEKAQRKKRSIAPKPAKPPLSMNSPTAVPDTSPGYSKMKQPTRAQRQMPYMSLGSGAIHTEGSYGKRERRMSVSRTEQLEKQIEHLSKRIQALDMSKTRMKSHQNNDTIEVPNIADAFNRVRKSVSAPDSVSLEFELDHFLAVFNDRHLAAINALEQAMHASKAGSASHFALWGMSESRVSGSVWSALLSTELGATRAQMNALTLDAKRAHTLLNQQQILYSHFQKLHKHMHTYTRQTKSLLEKLRATLTPEQFALMLLPMQSRPS